MEDFKEELRLFIDWQRNNILPETDEEIINEYLNKLDRNDCYKYFKEKIKYYLTKPCNEISAMSDNGSFVVYIKNRFKSDEIILILEKLELEFGCSLTWSSSTSGLIICSKNKGCEYELKEIDGYTFYQCKKCFKSK